MKRTILFTCAAVFLTTSVAIAGMGGSGQHMSGDSQGTNPGEMMREQGRSAASGSKAEMMPGSGSGYGMGYGMGPGMMGGYGMGPGMMGGYGMGPGMMGGYGMGSGMMGGCGMGSGMMHGYGMGQGKMGGYGMGPGMMGGYGMGPGMMQGYGMGQGKMGGYGMGPGMMHGYGMGPGAAEASDKYREKQEQFLAETRDLRKKMHSIKFDYSEALRDPDVDRDTLRKMEREMFDLQQSLYEKMRQ